MLQHGGVLYIMQLSKWLKAEWGHMWFVAHYDRKCMHAVDCTWVCAQLSWHSCACRSPRCAAARLAGAATMASSLPADITVVLMEEMVDRLFGAPIADINCLLRGKWETLTETQRLLVNKLEKQGRLLIKAGLSWKHYCCCTGTSR